MVAARLPTTLGRRLQSVTFLSPSRVQQRRWAQVHDVRFLATTQAPRNIAEKYREKLDRKARAEGLRDVNELKAAYADRIRDLKKRDSISIPGLDALLADEEPETRKQTQTQTQSQSQSQSQSHTKADTQTQPRSTTSPPSPKGSIKPLSEILDLPKARELPAHELSAVWRQYHASSSKNSLCAVIPTATYEALERAARAHPAFVLPVPRAGQGAEIHFLQWVFDATSRTSTVLFTQLAEYKARGEFAQPHTSVTHYADYGEGSGLSHEGNQGVVLMAGNVVEGRGASVDDARWLVMQLQRFYGEEGAGGDPRKRKLLEEFTRGDGGFSVERLLEETERIG